VSTERYAALAPDRFRKVLERLIHSRVRFELAARSARMAFRLGRLIPRLGCARRACANVVASGRRAQGERSVGPTGTRHARGGDALHAVAHTRKNPSVR
jgi:hypothetical protein